MDVHEFAALVLEQTQARLRADYPTSPQWEWERVSVKPGPVYTKVDVGPEHNMSGKYMIENATGIIFGIKGYGRVHKGHRYGTLATADQWYWGGYVGEKLPVPSWDEDSKWCQRHGHTGLLHGCRICNALVKRYPVLIGMYAQDGSH